MVIVSAIIFSCISDIFMKKKRQQEQKQGKSWGAKLGKDLLQMQ